LLSTGKSEQIHAWQMDAFLGLFNSLSYKKIALIFLRELKTAGGLPINLLHL
jgi:hypothetical protein